MGKFKHLVDSLAGMEVFRAKYRIPQGVGLQYCPSDQILTNREVGEVVIPMIAFIEGGMTLPMGKITRDYLLNHKLCPHQCAPNLFRVLGSVNCFEQSDELRVHMARRRSHVQVSFPRWGILPQISVRGGETNILPSQVQQRLEG